MNEETAAPLRHSVVRRSLLLTLFVIGGHAFYYVLVLSANRSLDPVGFGRFYAGWSILNVLVAPNTIVALLLTAQFAEAYRRGGAGAAARALARAGARLAPWWIGGLVLCQAALYVGGTAVGIDSLAIILVLPITAGSFLAVDTVRAVFPAILRANLYGVSWLLWCIGQCALGLAGLVVFGAPWAVFAGMLAANLLTFAALLPLVGRLAGTARADAVALPSLSLGRALPFCTAYAGFVLFNNADVFVAYLMLNATDLGAYSAAAVLPKAIVTATQPVANIVLPILVSLGEEGRRTRQAVVKGIAVTGILAALGAGVLWLGSDAVCGGRFGIRFCSAGPMLVLAAGSIGLSMARVSIAADLGRGRYWLAHLPLAACAAFVALGLASRADVPALASRYALTAMAVLAIMAAVKAARL